MTAESEPRAPTPPLEPNRGGVAIPTWSLEFFHERRRILSCHEVAAALPAEALRLGWDAVLTKYPSPPSGRVRGFEAAQRVGGQHPSGWRLYRIARKPPHVDATSAVSVAAPNVTRAPEGAADDTNEQTRRISALK